jgi:glutamate/tyrosine decarboxylase-like PLP-dependent enzyme
VLSREAELAACAELIGRLEAALTSAPVTPVPADFQPLWKELRGAVDGPGDLNAALDLLLRLPRSAADPGSPTYLGYVPDAALPFARAVDGYLSAVNAVAAGRIDGESFVQAEFAAADKVGELAGFPASTRGGTFVQGGTLANFCAMAAARQRWRRRSRSMGSPVVLGSRLAHSSLKVAARLLDMRFVQVEPTQTGAVDPDALAAAVTMHGPNIAEIIGNAGTTTAGSVDPLGTLAELAERCGAWFHVDGAYGGAVVTSARHRGLLAGLERADSFVVDPHKWLFCPYDSSLLLYRDVAQVHRELKVFSQTHETSASYLDFGYRNMPSLGGLDQLPLEHGELALQLSRRPRGVVLWALLAAYGAEGLGAYVDATIDAIARLHEYATGRGVTVPVAPVLSVLLLQHERWVSDRDWDEHWVRPAFARGWFVSTDSWAGVPVGRLCLTNPFVTGAELEPLVDMIADWGQP